MSEKTTFLGQLELLAKANLAIYLAAISAVATRFCLDPKFEQQATDYVAKLAIGHTVIGLVLLLPVVYTVIRSRRAKNANS